MTEYEAYQEHIAYHILDYHARLQYPECGQMHG